jgi:hypothetical protein
MTMPRRRPAVLLMLAIGTALVAVAGGLAVLPAAGAAGGIAGHERLRLLQHDTSQQYVDVGVAGPSVGDQFVFGGDVSRIPGAAKVGRMAGSCVNSSDTEILCSAAFTVGGDQITYAGIAQTATFYGGQPTDFAITGGTGRYREAAGTLTGTIQPDSSDAVFVVNLARLP